jgi:hypothetical protein
MQLSRRPYVVGLLPILPAKFFVCSADLTASEITGGLDRKPESFKGKEKQKDISDTLATIITTTQYGPANQRYYTEWDSKA